MALKESTWNTLAFIFIFICWLTTGEWFYIVPWVVMASTFVLFIAVIIFLVIFALAFRKTYEKHIQPFTRRYNFPDIKAPESKSIVPEKTVLFGVLLFLLIGLYAFYLYRAGKTIPTLFYQPMVP